MTRALMTLALSGVLAIGQSAFAQQQEEPPPPDPSLDGCDPAYVVDFSLGSADLDLGAESEVSKAANWATEEVGRGLLVVGPTELFPRQAQLGLIRRDVVIAKLLSLNMHLRAVAPGTYRSEERRVGT